jgi:diguanylate cyclase (GGDEF)-like protein
MVMRIVRLAALLGSVLLIMGAAVGYIGRRAQIVHERDLRVEVAASEAASRLDALLQVVAITADMGGDPAEVASATARQFPGTTVCAADEPGADRVCATSTGTAAPSRELASAMRGDAPTAVVADERLTATAIGEIIVGVELDGGVLLDIGIDDDGVEVDDADVVVTVVGRGAGTATAMSTVDGRRLAVARLAGADRLGVTATVPDDVSLARDERLALLAVSVLAVMLLGLAAATMRAEQRSLLERASIDPLTRLPNRSEFERRTDDVLATARRTGTGVCLLLFDLDGFKLINDTYGHQAGDDVLRSIGKRLRKAVREDDVVARWGGDEFVLVLRGIEDASAARSRAAALADMVSGETVGDGLRVGASVGIAMFPRHAGSLPELIEAADAAMYAAKRDGVTYRLAGVESAPLSSGIDPHGDRRRTPIGTPSTAPSSTPSSTR